MGMYAAVSARVGVCAGVVGLVTALAAPTIGVPTLRAQQTPGADEVLYDMADSMGMLRTNAETDMFMAVEWWASGSMADVGPDTIGPLVEVESLFAEIGYDFPGMRVDVTRAGEREIQVVSGEFAWNEIDEIGGGLVEGYGSAVPMPEAVSARLLRMWMTPAGVVKAMAAAGNQAEVTMEGGALVVTFPLVNGDPDQAAAHVVVGDLEGTPVKVTLNAERRPATVEVTHQGRLVTMTYSDYGDLNDADYQADIFLPAHVVRTIDGQTVLDLTIERSNTYNPYVMMPVPGTVRDADAQ
jgi:hypothetical protein